LSLTGQDNCRRLGIDGCHPHDTLAIFAALKTELFEWKRGRAQVVPDGPERGRSTFNADPAVRHYVANNIDTPRFFDLLEGTIENFKRPGTSK
jgi:inosine-uridine nucleoside N-ribohydrolase